MEPLQAIVLGIIQGLTEFLPISSSGHLVLSQHLFGLKEPELFFDISVHAGTLIAVIIYFWKEIQAIIVSLIRFVGLLLKRKVFLDYIWEDADVKLALLIIIGSVPTAFIGLLFREVADQLFSSVFIVGAALIVTGLLLWGTRGMQKEGESVASFSVKDALIIGAIQGLAIIPGISRSGSTIAAGLFLRLNRETAARYSFLLSIPAIIGAEILSLKDVTAQQLDMMTLLGTVMAGAVGYCALTLLVYIVKKGQLHIFSPYCWVIGIVALIWGW
ncbi:undecaprenyl-diphosphate phosphatase [Desulfonema magnum]|uniref:Undecaprenyl-diphosphatase n=1 Tax=Desulfonema magnum TaxID=45655 RepID=A0A975BMX7_9BACT|nr:undecaprenyl-diphosphate phosphatase [Desulfonema magnum]QTA88492.1 Undecaprenyl-diphosphatase [Desulfonema magnum]